MRLLVDIGNTQVKYVFQGKESTSKLSNIVYVAFQEQLAQGIFSSVNEVVVANVHGSEVLDAIEHWARKNNIACLQVHSSAKVFGITSSYLEPERLGVDRWLAMIGAKRLFPEQNLLIIDAGTATTVDLLAANGEHIGGWIMPGVEVLFSSLLNRTNKIVATPKAQASVAFGVDSSSCLNHGGWAMTIGAIKEAIIQANDLLHLDKVLITGGNAQEISGLITGTCKLESKLIFHGLSCFQAGSNKYIPVK
jgi:type III pantothenate kinase